MTFLERLLMGGATFCYAPDDGNSGGAGDTGGDDAGDSSDSGTDTADTGDSDSNTDTSSSDSDSSTKTGNSMLDALDDNEGIDFDFTTGEQPEGFPDEYWDAENGSVNAQALYEGLQKQEKIAKDLRAKMGKGDHKAPKDAKDYKLELSEELSAMVAEDDPLLGKAREVAHKFGMSQENFQGFMSEMMGSMAEAVAAAADENSPQNEEARKQYIKEQIDAIGPNGPRVLRAVESWGKELLAEGTFNEADVETFVNEGLTSAAMVQMLNRLRARMGGSDIPVEAVDDGLPPDSEIADMIEKAYESKDQAKINKVEKLLDDRRKAGRPEKLQF